MQGLYTHKNEGILKTGADYCGTRFIIHLMKIELDYVQQLLRINLDYSSKI